MKRTSLHWLSALLLLSLTACNTINTDPKVGQVEESLQAILEEAKRGSFDQIAGANMTVIAPNLDLEWTGSTGYDSKEREDEIQPKQAFRIASITKTYVATAMLRLVEEGRLELNAPIEHELPEKYTNMLREGGYDPGQITWRQILNHTSGLYDYAMGGDTYQELAMNNPQKRWTREEQVQLAMNTGKQVGAPGERYSYNDTGYVLAGAILEMKQDTNLGAAIRELLHFDQLGINSTWLETIEAQPAGIELPLVHCYFKHLDASKWDPSVDLYGGGGLVSTTEDMARFFQALFNDGIFSNPETLNTMLEPATYADSYDTAEDPRYKDYRLGLWKVELFGEEAYMHGGLWSTGLMHVPSLNCTVAVKLTNGWWDRQFKQVVLTIKNVQEKQ